MSEDLVERLVAKAAKRRRVDRGTYLFHQGDPVRAVFVVEEGLIELTRYQNDGTSIVFQRAAGRTVLAEASVYSASYHCDAVVAAPSRICEWPKAAFLARLHGDRALADLWAAHLAREVQSARYLSEILSRRTVAERLDGWMAWQGNEIPPKGRWKDVAVQIGVSPEALYRELAKRRPA